MTPRALIALSLIAAAGCATRTVPVQLTAGIAPHEVQDVPQYVEVHHTDQGWLYVPVEAGPDALKDLAAGETVDLATAELPEGTYDAVRLGFTSAVPTTDVSVHRGDDQIVEHTLVHEAAFVFDRSADAETFCSPSGPQDDPLRIRMVSPATPTDAPSIEVVAGPTC